MNNNNSPKTRQQQLEEQLAQLTLAALKEEAARVNCLTPELLEVSLRDLVVNEEIEAWIRGLKTLLDSLASAVIALSKERRKLVADLARSQSREARETCVKNGCASLFGESRTAREIVEQTNKIARLICRFSGFTVTPDYEFYLSDHPRGQKAWSEAVSIQELLTATDAENALAEMFSEGD